MTASFPGNKVEKALVRAGTRTVRKKYPSGYEQDDHD
jgi:hypothetical protein